MMVQPDSSFVPLGERSDAALLASILQQNEQALAVLYDRYGTRVFLLALRLLGDRQVAEEVTQDVFLRLWQRATTFHPQDASLLAWLLAITRNRSIDELRSRRASARRHEDGGLAYVQVQSRDDPQRRAEGRLFAADVRLVLTSLPPLQRRAVELAVFGGLTHREIAAAIEAPLGTVKGWLRQGLTRLRDALGAQWSDSLPDD